MGQRLTKQENDRRILLQYWSMQNCMKNDEQVCCDSRNHQNQYRYCIEWTQNIAFITKWNIDKKFFASSWTVASTIDRSFIHIIMAVMTSNWWWDGIYGLTVEALELIHQQYTPIKVKPPQPQWSDHNLNCFLLVLITIKKKLQDMSIIYFLFVFKHKHISFLSDDFKSFLK